MDEKKIPARRRGEEDIEKVGEDMDEWIFIRANLKANPRIKPFMEAVLKAADESGITVHEMKSAFRMLEEMAERRLIRTEVTELEMKLPEEKE